MSSPRRPASTRGRTTRGPLPPSVYWRRRIFVLGVAAALVLIIAGWLDGGSDGESDETPVAEQAGARVGAAEPGATGTTGTSPDAGAATATSTATSTTGSTGRGKKGRKPSPTLAAPEGTCEAADVRVTPRLEKGAAAGRDVTIALSLQTVESEACEWRVSPRTLVVRVASDDKLLWSTSHCPKVVPTQRVVVRRQVATVVELTWNARESKQGCRRATDWVLPGDYSIAASAYGGEPVVADFALASPTPETVTVSPEPTREPTFPQSAGKSPEGASGR